MNRVGNIILSFVLLVFFAPVLLALSIAQWAILGKPLFFRQERAGKNGDPFEIIKFRTMQVGTGTDDVRMTPWGRFLRTTSMDELPELWNVLKGDMNLVGPRPLPTHYLERYSTTQAQRHNVRPGLTGWAQVNGRNGLTWERQFDLDLWYIANRSCLLDLKILLLTILTVFRRDNISEPGHATRSEFLGSK